MSASASAREVVATAAAGGGQPALSVGFDSAGKLLANVCAHKPCSLAGGQELSFPAAAKPLVAHGRLSVVPLGSGRHAIVVSIPDKSHNRSWQAVVVAPLGGQKPDVVFQGWTGLVEGQYGLRHGPMVIVSKPAGDGSRRIVIGEQREDLQLCGRPAVLAPKLLFSKDLELHPAKVQRLSQDERSRAESVTAKRVEGDDGKAYPLLRAVGATSAVGQPAALTDGNPETTWAENRGGDGRGEFVLMNAPDDLPITGLDVVVRPPKSTPDRGVAPRDFWIATNKRLLHVTMPEDAWQHPGARYRITLEKPLHTDCVALVTGGAYGATRDSRVSFAELEARTEFDASKLEGLVGALAGGGKRAVAAGSALGSLGGPAFDAVAKRFDSLDEGGRRVALDVMDRAPCGKSVPVYLHALLGPYRAHRIHARDHIRQCGDKSAPLLEAAIKNGPPRARPLIAGELALVAPERAVRVIVPLLDSKSHEERRLLRTTLAHATDSSKATGAVRDMLRNDKLPEVAAIDLLRSLGSRLGAYEPEASKQFARLARPGASFRTRYLLLAPAAVLAPKDPAAAAFLKQSLVRDADGHVRAQAARVIDRPSAFRAGLLHALGDPGVRVREAAVQTLGEGRAAFAAQGIEKRLDEDPWPLVRSAAADALGRMGPDKDIDQALDDALDDSSKSVRAPVVRALGVRRARAYAGDVRDRLDDKNEAVEVRMQAARALGRMCDQGSLDLLTHYAGKAADRLANGDLQSIGSAAVVALGRLHPRDLKQRLAPLMGPRAPRGARFAAKAALERRDVCGGRR